MVGQVMNASVGVPQLSLREKAAQVVFAEFRFGKSDPEQVARLVRNGIGGLCVFGGSVFELAPALNAFQRLARVPLLMGADYEHGVGYEVQGATGLPTNMAVGATDSEELSELKGRVTAREARALGVPWLFAPVVDLQSNARNPIVNVRSFGENPERVTRLAAAFIRGAQEEGALVCLKHFPGHGDVTQDSHLVLPRVLGDRAMLRTRELAPFAALTPMADSVMTAHLLIEAFDRERPASLSYAVTTELLRGELGFSGLVVTDALVMGAIREVKGPEEAALCALEAGADVVLYPEDPIATVGAIVKAVERGRLSEEALDARVERIKNAKRKAGLFGSATVDVGGIEGVVGCPEHAAAARRIAEAAMTVAFDRSAVLPLRGKVRCVVYRDDSARGDTTQFERALATRLEVDRDASVGVLAVFSKYRSFSGRTAPDAELLARARTELGAVSKLIVVSLGSPYVISGIPGADAYLCGYGEGEATQVAAAHALVGEISCRGKLPVSLKE